MLGNDTSDASKNSCAYAKRCTDISSDDITEHQTVSILSVCLCLSVSVYLSNRIIYHGSWASSENDIRMTFEWPLIMTSSLRSVAPKWLEVSLWQPPIWSKSFIQYWKYWLSVNYWSETRTTSKRSDQLGRFLSFARAAKTGFLDFD